MNILDEKANNLPKKLFSTKDTKITKETKAIFGGVLNLLFL